MKKLVSLTLAAAMMFTMASCGSSNPAPQPTATDAQATENQAMESEAPMDKTDSANVIEFKLAENQPDDNPVTQGMQKFAELVAEKTEGSVKIEVYTNAQLGSESDTIDQVQANILDIARVNSVTLGQVTKNLQVFTLPYIFANQEHKFKVLDGPIGDAENVNMLKDGFVNLGYLEAGSRSFYSTKPITSLADLKGLKIRVQPSELTKKMVTLLGAIPTPMDYGEVFTSLQTGVIDGAENDYVSYDTSGHFEVAKNYLNDGHLSPPACLIFSTTAWAKLSEEQQAQVQEAAKEAIAWEREAMNKQEEASKEKVIAAGSIVTEANVEEFQNAVAPIYDDYPEFAETIKAIKDLQ